MCLLGVFSSFSPSPLRERWQSDGKIWWLLFIKRLILHDRGLFISDLSPGATEKGGDDRNFAAQEARLLDYLQSYRER